MTDPIAVLDATLPGAEFVAAAPEQFNDTIMADRRQPGEASFDVVAPDGYLHAMYVPKPATPSVAEGEVAGETSDQRAPYGSLPGETLEIPRAPLRGAPARAQLGQWHIAIDAPPTTLVELLMAATNEIACRGGGPATWWRAGATESDDRNAARVGFRRNRELHQLRVRLPISFDPNSIDGIEIDLFDAARDTEQWLAINNAAFAGHAEQSSWTAEILHERLGAPWHDPALFLVSRDPATKAMTGFNWLKIHSALPAHHEPKLGEIYVIGVAPEAQGQGLGYALAGLGLRALQERGIGTAMLFVAAENAPALALYRRLGFTTHRTDAAYTTAITPL